MGKERRGREGERGGREGERGGREGEKETHSPQSLVSQHRWLVG